MAPGLFRFFVVLLSALLLTTVGLVVAPSACTHQPGSPESSAARGWELTVDEADRALSASCVVLAQVMAAEHPELLERVTAQACQPGKTRQSLARLIAELTQPPSSSFTEHLELDPYGERGSGLGARAAELLDARAH